MKDLRSLLKLQLLRFFASLRMTVSKSAFRSSCEALPFRSRENRVIPAKAGIRWTENGSPLSRGRQS